ncbi:hypothetical protein FRC06_008399 [Ceratobasidium sp. 370]|nr:hypothetical protein FRC06_008399 [Ceratobasidium sp. 370]
MICEGTPDYPIYVLMETTVVFTERFSKDFIGQYYGPNPVLQNIPNLNPSDYRKIVLGAIDLISRDSVAILRGRRFQEPTLSLSIVLTVDHNTGSTWPTGEDSIAYANGETGPWTDEANIYVLSIWNLVNVVNDAVNLDLGSNRYPNLYTNTSVLSKAIAPNLSPQGISSSNWSSPGYSRSFIYGEIPPPYLTWAQALLAGQPVILGTATGQALRLAFSLRIRGFRNDDHVSLGGVDMFHNLLGEEDYGTSCAMSL